jgi:hypothetical protein
MGRKQNYFASRLLCGRNSLSVREKEDILQRVLSDTARRNDGSSKKKRLILSGAFAVAVAAIVTAFSLGDFSWMPIAAQQYQPRGGATETHRLKIRCVSSAGGNRCSPGDKLAVQVRGTADKPWFSAFSTVAGEDAVVWYYPQTSDKRSIAWQTADSDGWLPEGFIIGENQMPGTHLVYGIFSRTPLSRQHIRTLFKDGVPADNAEISVVTASFEVEMEK